MLIREAEKAGDTYKEEQPVECECGKFVDEVFGCGGCGDSYGCKSCMIWNEDYMDWFCDMDCVLERERKDRHEAPDFDGVFK